MELKLITPIEDIIPQSIQSNYAEIKQALQEKMDFYKTAVYTEDMIAEATADRAKLNNLAKQINSERITIGKTYDKPLKEFKEQMDELIEIINEGSSNIKKQLDGYETKRIAARQAELKAYWEEIAINYLANIPYERIEVKTWLNKSTQLKKAKAEMDSVLQDIKNDLSVLNSLSSEDVDELTLFYYETLSLAQTLQENEKRKAKAAQIAKMKAEKQAAEQRAAEERKAAQEAAERARMAQEQGENELPTNPYETAQEQVAEPEPELITVAFKATGTEAQIKALKRFLIENDIKISKV